MPPDCFALSGLKRLRGIHTPGRCPGLVCSSPSGLRATNATQLSAVQSLKFSCMGLSVTRRNGGLAAFDQLYSYSSS
jgi:hypothetical protein